MGCVTVGCVTVGCLTVGCFALFNSALCSRGMFDDELCNRDCVRVPNKHCAVKSWIRKSWLFNSLLRNRVCLSLRNSALFNIGLCNNALFNIGLCNSCTFSYNIKMTLAI